MSSLVEYAKRALELQLSPLQVAARRDEFGVGGIDEPGRRTRREQLARVVTALGSIDDESWGICRQCGDPIALEQLLSRPEADHCRNCSRVEAAHHA